MNSQLSSVSGNQINPITYSVVSNSNTNEDQQISPPTTTVSSPIMVE